MPNPVSGGEGLTELGSVSNAASGELAKRLLDVAITVEDGVLVFVPMAVDAPVPDGVIE